MAMPASPAPRPGWSLRRKAMTGGAIGILAVGFWLGTMLKGPGLGTGSGREGDEDADGGTPAVVAHDEVAVSVGNPAVVRPTEAGGSSGEPTTPAAVAPAEMIAVLVKGDGYGLLPDPPANASTLSTPLSQHFASATLEEVVAQAKAATGNAGGIKVQVVRHKSSTAGNRSALLTALRDAGIADGAIHVYTDFHD